MEKLDTYEEIVAYIDEIHKFTKKNGLEHTRMLIERLGHPDRRMELLHVAGSNGKGSVCAMMDQCLRDGGKKVGLFTSPHLVCLEERFRIDGQNVSRELFIEAFQTVMEASEAMMAEGETHPTYFELLFAMALVIFSKEHVEYAILETGLGGRLDCTNVIEEPLITIITSISLEHTAYLGDTIEKIAAEKAGIIKEGVPVIFDASDDTAAAVIKARAREVHAPFYEVKPSQVHLQHWDTKGIDFSFQCRYDDIVAVSVPFAAKYQMTNASLAYLAMELLSVDTGLNRDAIVRSMAHCKWPGRMQEIEPDIFVDGAHNPDGIRKFCESVKVVGGENPILLFTMVDDKDYQNAVRLLSDMPWDEVILTQVQSTRGLGMDVLAKEFMRYGKIPVCVENAKEAYQRGKADRKEGQRMFCAGSLYLAGEILSQNEGRAKWDVWTIERIYYDRL